jgi:hypothetical protein
MPKTEIPVEDLTELRPEVLIEEMQKAEAAPEPGTLNMKDIIHRGDEDLPASIVANALQSAGWVYIYDSKTFERSICNRNMLHDVLNKKREDGSRVFTTAKPKGKPTRGTHKCLLHPDQPQRKEYDALGLAVCKKSNLTSPYQVRRHMMMKHPAEWAAIQEMKKDADDKIDRAFKEKVLAKAV